MDKLSTDGNKAKDSVIIFDGKDPKAASGSAPGPVALDQKPS